MKMFSLANRNNAVACRIQQDEQDPIRGRTVKQRHGGKTLIQNEPMPPLDREELDRVYALEYTRTYHPMYERFGGVPALEEVDFPSRKAVVASVLVISVLLLSIKGDM
jgi:hypothetical protein